MAILSLCHTTRRTTSAISAPRRGAKLLTSAAAGFVYGYVLPSCGSTAIHACRYANGSISPCLAALFFVTRRFSKHPGRLGHFNIQFGDQLAA
eukprot:7357636-Pyramimonas_sp.AAC.1